MYDHKYGVKNYDSSALRIAPSTIKALETEKIGMKSGRPKYMKDNDGYTFITKCEEFGDFKPVKIKAGKKY